MGSDITHWLHLLREHSSLSSGLAIPLWGCRVLYPLDPAWFWLLRAGHAPCGPPAHPALLLPSSEGGSSLRSVFALCRLRHHAGLLLSGDALSTWLGFDPPRPGYHSVDALFILFTGALAHLPCSFPTEILSTPYTGREFSMPGHLFEGIPSLPLWAEPPFWATLLRGWPSCPHTVFGALSTPSWGSLSDLSSGLVAWLPFPALSASRRSAQALISHTRPSFPAVCPLCSVFLFSPLSYFISYALQIFHSSFIFNFISLVSIHCVHQPV